MQAFSCPKPHALIPAVPTLSLKGRFVSHSQKVQWFVMTKGLHLHTVQYFTRFEVEGAYNFELF